MPRAIEPNTRRQVIREYAQGVPIDDITARHGLKKSIVYKWAQAVGLRRAVPKNAPIEAHAWACPHCGCRSLEPTGHESCAA